MSDGFKARWVRGFFGFGVAFERFRMCEETEVWWALEWKVFLGPLVFRGTIRL
jgi:hypothetical protein